MSSTIEQTQSVALDTISASLVARQSRTNDGTQSVPDQIAAMRAWCERQSPPIEIVAVYEETDVSGRKPLDKRHGLKRAVEDVERGRSQMILTAYFDRFVRSVMTRAEVLSRVEANGSVVMTLDMGITSNATPVSKFSGVVLAAAAELIAEQAAEKTAISKQRNIDRGVPPFPRITAAYVRSADGTLRQHETNGPLIAAACRMRASGKSLQTICRYLAEHGLVVSIPTLDSTLSSHLLIGEIHFGKFRPNRDAIDEPVIDRATFRKMQSMRSPRGRYAKSERLLARQDVLRCATCNARMSVHSTSTRGKRYEYYLCGNRQCVKPALVAADVAETIVRDRAIELSAAFQGHASDDDALNAARVEREQIERRLDDAIESFATLSDRPAAKRVLDELQADLDSAIAREHRLAAHSTPEFTISTLTHWDALTLDAKRVVVRATIASAVVAPGRGPGRVAIVERSASLSG